MQVPSNTLVAQYFYTNEQSIRTSFTWYWQPESAGGDFAAYIAPAAESHFNAVKAMLAGVVADQNAFEGVRLSYHTGSNLYIGYSSSASEAGSHDCDALPMQDTYVIQKDTAKGGRSNRGRIFISGVPEVGVAEGIITSESLYNQLAAIATYFGADKTIGDFGICHSRHWNRKTNTMVPIVSCHAMNSLYSRRDRARKVLRVPGFTPTLAPTGSDE